MVRRFVTTAVKESGPVSMDAPRVRRRLRRNASGRRSGPSTTRSGGTSGLSGGHEHGARSSREIYRCSTDWSDLRRGMVAAARTALSEPGTVRGLDLRSLDLRSDRCLPRVQCLHDRRDREQQRRRLLNSVLYSPYRYLDGDAFWVGIS